MSQYVQRDLVETGGSVLCESIPIDNADYNASKTRWIARESEHVSRAGSSVSSERRRILAIRDQQSNYLNRRPSLRHSVVSLSRFFRLKFTPASTLLEK